MRLLQHDRRTAARDMANPGEPCGAVRCTAGYACIGAPDADTCAVPPSAGQPCAPSGGGLVCSPPAWCSDGGCVPGAGLGQRCSSAIPCASGFCVLAGGSPTGQCTAFAATGQLCGADNLHPHCDPSALLACVNGICAPLGGVGAPCGTPDAAPCDSTMAFCMSGVCEAISSASRGEACSPPTVTCFSSLPCEAGVCNGIDPSTCSADAATAD
jgi:hypothetical protein